jgi:hypothetical protein
MTTMDHPRNTIRDQASTTPTDDDNHKLHVCVRIAVKLGIDAAPKLSLEVEEKREMTIITVLGQCHLRNEIHVC